MKLAVSEEQRELRDAVRRFCDDKAPVARARALMDTESGYDAAVWTQAAQQLGLPGMAIPEEYGGAGFTFVEQAIVLEELGAVLYGGPYLASAILAANALLAGGDDQAKRDLLPGIAAGETVATLAFTEDDGGWGIDATTLGAKQADDGWVLDGHKNFVLAGHTADLLLVVGRTPAGLSLFAVEAGASGLTRTPLATLDQTRGMARLEFASTPARLIGAEGAGAATLGHTLNVAAVAQGAEQLGGAQRALDMTLDYLKLRHQFGRALGSFEALKHRCADLLMEVESARSAITYAAWAVAQDDEELPVVASLVKAYASETFFHVAAECIQMHGGIGFTWEHDAHLYFKRAKSSELFLGGVEHHRDALADRLSI
jgi:alkylation response protein AidB-like acyl-CoA dehydrogenase